MHAQTVLYINVFLTIIFLFASGYLKYIRRKQFRFEYVLIFFTFLAIWSIFRAGSYQSGDLSIHVMKAMSFYQALSEGVLVPRWSDLNAGYGYPQFIFSYILPYYFIAIFHWIGFSFLFSTKILLASSFALSGIAMYWWIRMEYNIHSARIASALYLFAPYHLVDLHYRVALGEVVSFIFIPLLFGSFYFIRQGKWVWTVFGGILYGSIILSHQATTLAITVLYILYVLLFAITSKNLRTFINGSTLVIYGLLFTAWYWIPALGLKQYTQLDFQNAVETLQLTEVLFAPWKLGFLYQGSLGELSYVLGYGHWLILFLSILVLFKVRNVQSEVWFFTLASVTLIFLLIDQSAFIWQYLPLFRNIQFSSRLLVPLAFTTSVLSGLLTFYKYLSPNKANLLAVIAILITMPNWAHRINIPTVTDQVIRENMSREYAFETLRPALPIWFDYEKNWINQEFNDDIKILKGSGTTEIITYQTHKKSYVVDATTPVEVVIRLAYFPGWKVFVNNEMYPFTYKDPRYPGVILLSLPAGKSEIALTFSLELLQ